MSAVRVVLARIPSRLASDIVVRLAGLEPDFRVSVLDVERRGLVDALADEGADVVILSLKRHEVPAITREILDLRLAQVVVGFDDDARRLVVHADQPGHRELIETIRAAVGERVAREE